MTEQPIGPNSTKIINVIIFTFPIVINSLQVAGDILLFILAMMGISIAISKKLSPFTIKEIKVFSYLTFGYFLAVCLSVLFSGQAVELAHYIPRDLHFLFAPFIALAMYKAEININYLVVGVKVALLVLGLIVIIKLVLLEIVTRTGVMNPGVFGNLSVALFFIALVFSKNESFKQKIFSIFALLSGFIAVIGSGTRGSWLAFLLLLGFYLYFSYKQKIKFRIKAKTTVLFIIVILSIGSIFDKLTYERINDGRTQIVNYLSGDREAINSISERLEMYRAGIDNIEEVPLFFGHGYRTSNIALFQNDTSNFGKLAVGYNHLHNAYLTNYYNGGIFLLGALLLLLFVPLRIFLKANKKNCKNPIYISGVLLTLGYMSFGMVNILLGDTYMNGFYVFFLAILMVLHAKSIKA